jgi:hypothetical protein
MVKKEKAEVVKSVVSLEEFDALLKVYKEQSPEKYEAKKKSGEFDRKKAKLKSGKKKVEKAEEPKVEKKKK